jgi:hypothetical protein
LSLTFVKSDCLLECQIQALKRSLDVQKQVCEDAEIRCQQMEDMLMSEKRSMEGMMSLKAELEAQIMEVGIELHVQITTLLHYNASLYHS